jgi:hypothetical protein
MKYRAAARGFLGLDSAAVRLDDRTRDRQAESHSCSFRAEERIEELR